MSVSPSAQAHVVTIGGCSMHVDVIGNGPRVLMIQGVGVHGDGWLPQVEAMHDRFTLSRFDNRGMGRSQPAGVAPLTVERMVDDAIAVMDALSWPDAHVVGHSLSGLVALGLALRIPARVRSLALLCTFANGRLAAPPTARMIWYGARSRIGTRRMRRRGFLRIISPPGGLTDADAQAERLAPLFGHDLADTPPVVGPQLRAMRAADLTSRLGELATIPTLVVSAAHDLIAPPTLGRAMAAAISGARFVEVPNAAHGLPVTHAAITNRLLADHWSATPNSSA